MANFNVNDEIFVSFEAAEENRSIVGKIALLGESEYCQTKICAMWGDEI